jgi:hypothetical protein
MTDLLLISPGGRRKRPDLGPMLAAERYDGLHHRLVMRGVTALRAAGLRVEVRFLSPKWGLVAEEEPLLDYDLDLTAMGRAGAAAHLAALGLPEALKAALQRAPLAVLLLPGKYLTPLRALGAAHWLQPSPGGRALAFLAPSEGALPGAGLTSIPCAPALTRSFQVANTALKGRLFQALATGITRDPAPALAALRADPTPATAWRLIDQGR